jgi:hypothetical protein
VARAAGVREATASLEVNEPDTGAERLGRMRRPGGGRKQAADLDPGPRSALLTLASRKSGADVRRHVHANPTWCDRPVGSARLFVRIAAWSVIPSQRRPPFLGGSSH